MPVPYFPQVVRKTYDIINTDRAALGRVAGAIARHHGDKGFAGTVGLTLHGSGGQSFGCFCIQVRMACEQAFVLHATGWCELYSAMKVFSRCRSTLVPKS